MNKTKYQWGQKKPRTKRQTCKVNQEQKEIDVEDIVLIYGRRPVNSISLKAIQKSIEREGLRHAIQVYPLTGIHKGRYGLSAGLHRLTAVKNLGFEKIAVNILPRSDAKRWLASENLHTARARVLDRSEDIVRYQVAHREIAAPEVASSGGQQPNDRGIAKLSKLLAIDRKRVAEAFLHHALSPKVKSRLRKHKLDNNRKFLNEVAQLQTELDQIHHINKKAGLKSPRKSVPKERTTELSLTELAQRWKMSAFRRIFESQNEVKRTRFAKKYLGVDL